MLLLACFINLVLAAVGRRRQISRRWGLGLRAPWAWSALLRALLGAPRSTVMWEEWELWPYTCQALPRPRRCRLAPGGGWVFWCSRQWPQSVGLCPGCRHTWCVESAWSGPHGLVRGPTAWSRVPRPKGINSLDGNQDARQVWNPRRTRVGMGLGPSVR